MQSLVAAFVVVVAGTAGIWLAQTYWLPTQPAAPMQASPSTVPTAAGSIALLSPDRERALRPKDSFKECDRCPEMVVVPAGGFTMGSPGGELGRHPNEDPQHRVTIAQPFAVGRYAVTFDEWDACGCNGYAPGDNRWGRGRQPVIGVSWNDAKAYVSWLAQKTGKSYRLLSEAEREYVTRAGTTTPFWWGSSITTSQANYDGGTYAYGIMTARPENIGRGRYRSIRSSPNPWGLYQVHGNVWEWVEDCYHDSYAGAPADGSVWTSPDCREHVLRGGAWSYLAQALRSADRNWRPSDGRNTSFGFRVARMLAR